jgi:hypothetical protein
MTAYRVYYCDKEGMIFSANDFLADSDAAARERAGIFTRKTSGIFEVWERDRLVHRHWATRSTPVTIWGAKPPPLDRAASRDRYRPSQIEKSSLAV